MERVGPLVVHVGSLSVVGLHWSLRWSPVCFVCCSRPSSLLICLMWFVVDH